MKFLQTIFWLVVMLLGVLLVISCSSEEEDSQEKGNIVRHPIEENIPYHNRDHFLIDTVRSVTEMESKPGEVILLHRYLDNPDHFETKKLDIAVGGEDPSFNVISIGRERLIILDPENDKLTEYILNTDSLTTIAEIGRGPGDIMFMQEMVKDDEGHLYIAEANMRISTFDYASVPTAFSEVIPLKFSPSSIAPSGDSLAILGVPDVRSVSDNNKMGTIKAIRLLNKKEEEVAKFGEVYDIGDQRMLLRPFIAEGMIKYSPKEKVYILGYNRLPLLYIYDAKTLQIQDTYQIFDFILGKQRYWPDTGRLEVTMEDHSAIQNIRLIDEQYLWLEVVTRRKTDQEMSGWDREMAYYIIDLSNNESYYIGGSKTDAGGPGRQLYLTDIGLVIQKEGSLYFVQ